MRFVTFSGLYWAELGKLQGHFHDKSDFVLLIINGDNNWLWQQGVCDNPLQDKMATIDFLMVWHHKDVPTMKCASSNLHKTYYHYYTYSILISVTNLNNISRGRIPKINASKLWS